MKQLPRQLQLTLAILKPDLTARPASAKAVQQLILQEGFYIVRSKVITWSLQEAETFYSEHRDRFFFTRLTTFMSSGPINPLILAGDEVIQKWRTLMGPTKTYKAKLHATTTIRGIYGLTDTRNSVHGSDNWDNVLKEINCIYPDFNYSDWLQNEEIYFQQGQVQYDTNLRIHRPLIS